MTPGIELTRAFWHDCVRPLLGPTSDRLGAALLGQGSEVLGFDDEVSADHDYGPRLQLLVPTAEVSSIGALEGVLDEGLPDTFGGSPVRLATTVDPAVRHQVWVTTITECFETLCGLDPTHEITDMQWLRTPTQLLASVTAGAVFADPQRELETVRAALSWYPEPVWRYVLACQWRRIAQEESFMARAADVHDDLGSRLIAGRLAHDLMRLTFLVERRWAPYTKWLGTSFAQLDGSDELGRHLRDLVGGDSGPARQDAYLLAAGVLADAFNALGLEPALDAAPRRFHGRDAYVLDAQRFADAVIDRDSLARWGWRGAIDQWVDNTDVLSSPSRT